jgi:DNA-binding NtrC family response regulator
LKFLNENRPRLLIISPDDSYQKDLVAILTGFGFYIDYQSSLKEAMRSFKTHRHALVFIDEELFPPSVERLFHLFRKIQKRCVIIVLNTGAVTSRYLNAGAYDVINKTQDLHSQMAQFNRVVVNHHMMVRNNLLQFTLLLFALGLPLIIMLFVKLIQIR